MPTPQGKQSRTPRTPRDTAGPKRATVQEVAEAAGVSTATVSRVLNGNYPVAADTRRKVEQAVRTLGYVVNAHARALAGSRTRTVGIIVQDIIDPFYTFIAHGVQRQAAEDGKLCLVCSTYGVVGGELDLIDALHEQRADAVILVGGGVDDPAYRRKLADRARALGREGSWLVLCGRPALEPGVPAGVVDYDNTGGAHAITEYLLGLGHRRILYVGGPEQLSVHQGRVAGFRRAYASRVLELDERLIQPGAFSRRFGYERVAQLLRDGSAGVSKIERMRTFVMAGKIFLDEFRICAPRCRITLAMPVDFVDGARRDVIDVIRSIGSLGKHVHFHLHDGHPLIPGLSDHFTFLRRLPIPFSYQGRQSLSMMYGPGGLESVIWAATEACRPGGASFTLEIHQVEGRLPLADASRLFAHWRDLTNAERMNYWLSVLGENAILLSECLAASV